MRKNKATRAGRRRPAGRILQLRGLHRTDSNGAAAVGRALHADPFIPWMIACRPLRMAAAFSALSQAELKAAKEIVKRKCELASYPPLSPAYR